MTEIEKFGRPTTLKDKKKEKRFEYNNGLILKSFVYESYKTSDSDGVLCLFDARDKKSIDPTWIAIISDIIKGLKKNKVISVGIRVSKDENWSELIGGFNLDEDAENRLISLLFFRIKDDNVIDVFEQLSVTLNTIKNLSFSY